MFCLPSGNESVTMPRAGGVVAGTAVMLSAAVSALALTSVTRTVKIRVPVPVTVPEITPVLATSVSPSGRVPAMVDHE